MHEVMAMQSFMALDTSESRIAVLTGSAFEGVRDIRVARATRWLLAVTSLRTLPEFAKLRKRLGSK